MFSKIAATIIAAALLSPLVARAADVPSSYRAPAYVTPYVNWTGLYVGINGGYGFGSSVLDAPPQSSGSFNVNGAMIGGTLGYNYQTGALVWGIEGDYDYSRLKGSTSTICTPACETKNDWLATARGRIGYAGWNNFLPYITGGAAFGNIKEEVGVPFNYTKTGYALGAGLEYAFLNAWSVKAEYLYVDLGKASCPAASCGGTAIDVSLKANVARLGLNYRF